MLITNYQLPIANDHSLITSHQLQIALTCASSRRCSSAAALAVTWRRARVRARARVKVRVRGGVRVRVRVRGGVQQRRRTRRHLEEG